MQIKNIKYYFKIFSVKDIAILTSGTLIAQVITMALQPITTRVYTPAEFGLFNLLTSTIQMFVPLIIFQYDSCIVTAKTDEEANKVTALSFFTLFTTVTIFALGLLVYNLLFPSTFIEAGLWVYTTIGFLAASGIANIVSQYNNRFRQYSLMSKMSIYRASVSNPIKIILGFAGLGFIGFILSYFLSIVLGLKKQAFYLISNAKEIRQTSFDDIKSLAKKYIAQPLYSSPGLFMVGFAYSVIPFQIKLLYHSNTEIGLYALAVTVVSMPLRLISDSVAKIFFKNASEEMHKTGGFRSAFKRTSILLALISTVPFTILFFTAAPLFGIIFGKNWIQCGIFVQALIPLYFTRFIVNSVISGLIICGAQKAKLIIQSQFVVVSIVIFLISQKYEFSIEKFLFLIGISYAIIYIILLGFIYKKSKPQGCN